MAGLICGMSWGSCSVICHTHAPAEPEVSQPHVLVGQAQPSPKPLSPPQTHPQGGFPSTASSGAVEATSPTIPGAGTGPGSAVFPRMGHAFQPPVPYPRSRLELPAAAEHLHLHPQRPGPCPRAGGAGSDGAGTPRRRWDALLLTAPGAPGCPTGTGVGSRDCTRAVPPCLPAIKDLLCHGLRVVPQPRRRFGHGREGPGLRGVTLEPVKAGTGARGWGE